MTLHQILFLVCFALGLLLALRGLVVAWRFRSPYAYHQGYARHHRTAQLLRAFFCPLGVAFLLYTVAGVLLLPFAL